MAAEQTVVNSVASAVTGEFAGRALSGLIGKFGKQATADEKLQRLEMLLIKIHSAVEASEKHAVENTWLIRWRDKLKDATSEGDQVLASFRSRASDAQAAAGNADKPHDGASSSTTSTASPATATATGTALSFTRIALSGMAQGIHSARMMLFPSEDEGMERLNATVEKLGQLSADIGEFVRLLQLEVLQKTEQKQLEKKTENVAVAAQEPQGSNTYSFAAMVDEPSNASAPSMINRLRGALPAICTAVKQAENSYLNDREWLASWADILREAERQGSAVLRATVEFDDQENDELCRFVRSMESLVRDVWHFSALASLCPSY
ncbi:hypothetical protein PVAP13_9NG034700 [Panicum virgatum]|uniref:Rx N-terminal domain-containing protein n=1 Tax=Panicum virgatum TaxID=38727 RepID=A0A8T0MB02_PANVG|nr:hypothetical protein PVAP13_9NG034700 [Panicum virgatum]